AAKGGQRDRVAAVALAPPNLAVAGAVRAEGDPFAVRGELRQGLVAGGGDELHGRSPGRQPRAGQLQPPDVAVVRPAGESEAAPLPGDGRAEQVVAGHGDPLRLLADEGHPPERVTAPSPG